MCTYLPSQTLDIQTLDSTNSGHNNHMTMTYLKTQLAFALCYVYVCHVLGSSCRVFVCLGFAVSSVCKSRFCHSANY